MANQRTSPWNDLLDARLRMLWDAGHSTAEIGAMMGVTKNSVIGRAHRLHLTKRASPIVSATPREWTRAEDETVRVLLRGRYSVRWIARKLGVSDHVLRLRINELDLAQRRQVRETARAATESPVRARGAASRGHSHPQGPAAAPSIPAKAGDPSRPAAERTTPSGETGRASVDVSSLTLTPPVALPAPAGTFCRGPCRWPLWGDRERPTQRFCDQPRTRGAYCEAHAKRGYTMTVTEAGPAPVARWA